MFMQATIKMFMWATVKHLNKLHELYLRLTAYSSKILASIVVFMLLLICYLVSILERGSLTSWRKGQKALVNGCLSPSHSETGSQGSQGCCGVLEFVSSHFARIPHF